MRIVKGEELVKLTSKSQKIYYWAGTIKKTVHGFWSKKEVDKKIKGLVQR